jgi:hypothetical protein
MASCIKSGAPARLMPFAAGRLVKAALKLCCFGKR